MFCLWSLFQNKIQNAHEIGSKFVAVPIYRLGCLDDSEQCYLVPDIINVMTGLIIDWLPHQGFTVAATTFLPLLCIYMFDLALRGAAVQCSRQGSSRINVRMNATTAPPECIPPDGPIPVDSDIVGLGVSLNIIRRASSGTN